MSKPGWDGRIHRGISLPLGNLGWIASERHPPAIRLAAHSAAAPYAPRGGADSLAQGDGGRRHAAHGEKNPNTVFNSGVTRAPASLRTLASSSPSTMNIAVSARPVTYAPRSTSTFFTSGREL